MMPTFLRNLTRRITPRLIVGLGAASIVAYGVVVLIAMSLEDRLIFHPVVAANRWIDPPSDVIFHDVQLTSADGLQLHARWYPCPNAKFSVLFCHSRAGKLSLELGSTAIESWSRELECSILIFDYPGYGRSQGQPSEAGFYAAADAAYDWLTDVQRVPDGDVLIYGRSIGSAVAVDLASRRPHRALILVSPMTSLPDAAWDTVPIFPTHALMRNRFDSLAKIGRCTLPVFIVHGTRDRVVPYTHGVRLFAAANDPKHFLTATDASHGNVISDDFYKELRTYLLASNFAQDGKPMNFQITTRKPADSVVVRGDNERTTFAIKSPSGIGQAVIERAGDAWPKEVIVRLHLNGLENFRVSSGVASLNAAASIEDGNPLIRLWKDGKENAPLNAKDALWTNVRIIAEDGKPARSLPLKNGHFEMTLPAALFEANPKSLTLSWIDFYRN